MDECKLNAIADRWEYLVDDILDLSEMSIWEMQDLLRYTYKALTAWHKKKLTPKGISRILLSMEHYLYFARVMESDEVPDGFYLLEQVFSVVRAMEQGFFDGAYPCAFPLLELRDSGKNRYVINLEENFLPIPLAVEDDEECSTATRKK